MPIGDSDLLPSWGLRSSKAARPLNQASGFFIAGYFFVHFSAGQLRPMACGTLSFEGKNVSSLGKNASFFLIGSFFQFSSKERPAVL